MEPNPKWLCEYSITHIKRHHLFFNDSLRDRAAIVRTEPLLELYNAPVSTCSQKVRIALWEKDLPWQDRPIVFQKNDHLSDWCLAINPNGVVPALVHDGKTIIDSSVINEYLEDVFPERSLRPRDAVEVAHMRAWRQFIDEVPTVAIHYPSFNAAFVHIWSDMSAMKCVTYAKGCR